MRYDFSKEVVLVTGASRGIGRAIALCFAAAGARVAINYVGNEGAAMETLSQLRQHGVLCGAYRADVSRPDQVESMFSAICRELGPVTILINNAGILHRSFLMMTSADDFTRVVDINVKGVFNCTKAAFKQMIRQKSGVVVNVSSLAGGRGLTGQSSYAASKAAVNNLTAVSAKEMGNYGIRVIGVAPGCIDAGMMKDFSESPVEEYLRQIPLKRYGTAEEVAQAVMFLSSAEASYITGTTLSIDGGMSL